MKLIIVEGIGQTGKSTFIKELSEVTGFKSVRMFGSDNQKPNSIHEIAGELEKVGVPVNDYYEDLIIIETLKQLEGSGIKGVILDRSFPSGYVYRKISDKSDVNEKLLKWWFDSVSNFHTIYFWLYSQLNILNKRAEKTGKRKIDKKDFDMLGFQYLFIEKILSEYKISVNSIDNSHLTLEEFKALSRSIGEEILKGKL